MSGDDIDLTDLLGPEPEDPDAPAAEVLVDEKPKSRPMGAAARAQLERSRSYPLFGLSRASTPRTPRKNTPERLTRILGYVAEMPVIGDVCRRANIHIATLKYWLQKSKEGRPGDGFDIVLPNENDENGSDGNTERFHVLWDLAAEVGMSNVEAVTHRRAAGYPEPLTYKGKVMYQLDPDKYELAMLLGDPIDDRNPAMWLRDANGAPVPETVWKMDPELAMFLLKTKMSKTYGAKAQLDVNVSGGVLVIPMRATTSEELNVIEEEYRREGAPEVLFDESDDADE